MKKAQLNLSFGWIFAIIVGAVILLLTIYGVTKFINTSGQEQDIAGAKKLGILFNSLETGPESVTSTPFKISSETKIYNTCNNFGGFGKQKISFSTLTFKKWSSPSGEVSFKNRYLFSNRSVQGKKFYFFVKPFEFPFKVADLVYLTSADDKYCFDDGVPDEVKEEISDLNQENIAPNCSEANEQTIEICFSGTCEIEVNLYKNYVKKGDDTLYFVTPEKGFGEKDYSLMYAAIFSDKKTYECQLKRLLFRTKELALLYKGKIKISREGLNLEDDLTSLITQIEHYNDSSDLKGFTNQVETLKQKNENVKLW